MLQWFLANGLNRIEWVLLTTPEWEASGFVSSPLRQQRLANLTAIVHAHGLLAGVDVPIAEQQQHAWYIVNVHDPEEKQAAALKTRVEWLGMGGAGFDFINSENGLSEVRHCIQPHSPALTRLYCAPPTIPTATSARCCR